MTMLKLHEAATRLIFQVLLAAVLFFAGLLLVADGVQLLLDVGPKVERQERPK